MTVCTLWMRIFIALCLTHFNIYEVRAGVRACVKLQQLSPSSALCSVRLLSIPVDDARVCCSSSVVPMLTLTSDLHIWGEKKRFNCPQCFRKKNTQSQAFQILTLSFKHE